MSSHLKEVLQIREGVPCVRAALKNVLRCLCDKKWGKLASLAKQRRWWVADQGTD